MHNMLYDTESLAPTSSDFVEIFVLNFFIMDLQ